MLKPMFIRLSATLCLLTGVWATAHHSAAGVDTGRTLTVSGTLKEFDFSAPHAQVIVVSHDEKGTEVETKVSTIAPAGLIRQGFKVKDFESGQQVQMSYHPNINNLGGILVTLQLQDGRIVKGDI